MCGPVQRKALNKIITIAYSEPIKPKKYLYHGNPKKLFMDIMRAIFKN